MKNCICCGSPITGRRKKYCSDECMKRESHKKWRECYVKKVGARNEKQRVTDRMNDETIWNHDYAETQKQKTLNLLGPIRIEDYK